MGFDVRNKKTSGLRSVLRTLLAGIRCLKYAMTTTNKLPAPRGLFFNIFRHGDWPRFLSVYKHQSLKDVLAGLKNCMNFFFILKI